MKSASIAFVVISALAMSLPAEAGGRGHGGHGGHNGQGSRGGPVIGVGAGTQVGAKLNVLNIVKIKAGLGLGLGLGLGGR